MFSIFVLIFIIIELAYIVNVKKMLKNNLDLIAYKKEFEGKEFSEYSRDYKNAILYGFLQIIIIFVVIFGGLLTDQWILWLSLLIFNIFIILPITKLMKKYKWLIGNYVIVWINSVLGLCIGLFYIVNHYHLHIDLIKLIQNFL